MKLLLRLLVPIACLMIPALPVMAAEMQQDYESDAHFAEGTPPMVPHPINDMTGDACLACHLSGKNGAPLSPHPVRLDCTQCHGQGEIKEKKPGKKKHHKD
jgi:cytochrome c-type protein NapB